MANLVYTYGIQGLVNQSISWTTDTIKARLITSTYTADKDHQYMASVGGGIANDVTLSTNRSVTADTSEACVFCSCAVNPQWTGLDATTAAAVVLFKFVSDDDDSVPLVYYDTTDLVTTTGMTVTLTWASSTAGGALRCS